MTPADGGPDERSYDYATQLGALPGWGALVLVAGVATRVAPVYEVLADSAENAAYTRVVEALWRAREVDTGQLRGLHDDLVALWPEEEEEMDDLTPYYWKVRALHVLKVGLEHAVDDSVRGARMAEQAALDVVDDLDARVVQEGIDRPLAAASQEDTPYSAREFAGFVDDVATLRDEADPDTAVGQVRERSVTEADFLNRELLSRWIRAEGWTQADLETAHGAEQNGR